MKRQVTSEQEIPQGEGWDWFEQARQIAQEATQERADIEQKELALSFARVFNSPDGKIVFDHLQDWIEKVKTFDPDLGFYNGAAYGFWRGGQNSMIQYLKTMTAKGSNNGRRKPRK